MNPTIEVLKKQLQTLSTADRAELAYFLLESLEPEDEGVEAAWDEVLQRRMNEIKEGRAVGIPAEELFAKSAARGRPEGLFK